MKIGILERLDLNSRSVGMNNKHLGLRYMELVSKVRMSLHNIILIFMFMKQSNF
jgi:hypothetical protein